MALRLPNSVDGRSLEHRRGAAAEGASDRAPRLHRLVDELRALEARAGIDAAAERMRWHLNAEPGNRRLRHELRDLYFGVVDASQRQRLIAKHREISRFERAWTESDLVDAARRGEELDRRSREGWWMAAVVGAALIIAGYTLFALAGGLAAAVVAVFVGNGIEQESRRRHERAIDEVRKEIASMEMRESDHRELFSETEERLGAPDATSLGEH